MHEFVEGLFKSFESIAQYFREPNPPIMQYNESCGLDLTLLYTFCDIIDRFPLEDSMRKVLLKTIVDLLMKPVSATLSKTDLQAYFALLHLPIFIQLNTYVVFSFLIRQVATMKPQNIHQMMCFFNKAGEVSIRNVAKMLKKFIDKRFFPPSEDALPPSKECSWWIPMSCKCLAILFAANANQNAPLHVDIKTFYCRSMDSLELLEDFKSWSTGVPKRSFTFCQYSFIITSVAKRRLMTQANQLEMMGAARDKVDAKIRNRENTSKDDIFVDFSVRRTHLMSDSVKEIVAKQRDLKRKLRVNFVGEEGVDLGGLTKEWFLLMVPKVFSSEMGLFVRKSSKYYWLNGGCKGMEAEFFFAGALLGLAIYNSVILDVALPVSCFKKLLRSDPNCLNKFQINQTFDSLSPPVSPPKNSNVQLGLYHFTLHDFAELEPEVAQQLTSLLTYTGNVEHDFGLDFCLAVDENGESKNYTLKKNGHKIKVTNQNKVEYVSMYVGFQMNIHIQNQFAAFYKGFHSVCNSDVLSILKAEELQSIVCGEPYIGISNTFNF